MFITLVWGSFCYSLAFGEVGFLSDLSCGLWTGVQGETTLGKNTVSLWSLYTQEVFFLWLKTGYQWLEGFVSTEALDYGYQERGENTPVIYTLESTLFFRRFLWEAEVGYGFSQICYEEVTIPRHEWSASVAFPLGTWQTRLGWGNDRVLMGVRRGFWWERCYVDIAILGFFDEYQEVLCDLRIWNHARDLGFFWRPVLYRNFQHQEMGSIGFFKQWATRFVSCEVAYSEWDAGRVSVRGGWKW